METIYGNIETEPIECVNQKYQKWIIRWNIQPRFNSEHEQIGTMYNEQWVLHKPSIDEIKDIVLTGYNELIDQKIVSSFSWKNMQVWLSTENQFNYKAAYDLAVMSQGKSLPTIFKFGTTEEPVYYAFETLEDISDFYISAMAHINTCLAEGWKLKDSIDWNVYEEALK